MSKSKDSATRSVNSRPVVRAAIEGSPSFYVLVSHSELDNLISRLMQMCELMGDSVQREALKQEIKSRSRFWLDELYKWSGYDTFAGIAEYARLIEDTYPDSAPIK